MRNILMILLALLLSAGILPLNAAPAESDFTDLTMQDDMEGDDNPGDDEYPGDDGADEGDAGDEDAPADGDSGDYPEGDGDY